MTLYVLSEHNSTWVLALNTTESSHTRRVEQQKMLETQLNQAVFKKPLVTNSPRSSIAKPAQFLECAVLQLSPAESFKLVGKATLWIESIMTRLSAGVWLLREEGPINPYYPLIKKHWMSGSTDAYASDWIRIEFNNTILRMRAKAMTVSNRHLLVLQAHEDRAS